MDLVVGTYTGRRHLHTGSWLLHDHDHDHDHDHPTSTPPRSAL
jgi:hypothetical protein